MRHFKAVICGFFIVFLLSGVSFAEYKSAAERAASILEISTSFHWGKDCLVWLVHYPEELVGPWIDADPKTAEYTEEQKAQYRRSFKDQLRMNDSEPFLVTIYNFGSAPLKVTPLSEYLHMVSLNGDKIDLVSYEKKLDQPISGIVQGLAFFPKQNGSFKLVFKGLGVYPEQVFAFPVFAKKQDLAEKTPSTEVKDHIVELPLVDVDEKDSVPEEKKENPPTKKKDVAEAEKITPSIEEPPAWLGPGPVLTPEKKEEAPVTVASRDVLPEDKSESVGKDTSEKARDMALKEFLSAWGNGRFADMYRMLSSEITSEQSLEDFSARAKKSSIRWNLSKGYKLTWLNPKKVKVSVAQRLVLIRVLQSEVLRVKMENGRWCFAW